jgi:hypothetical protein
MRINNWPVFGWSEFDHSSGYPMWHDHLALEEIPEEHSPTLSVADLEDHLSHEYRSDKNFNLTEEERSFLIKKFSELWLTTEISKLKDIIKHFPCTFLMVF